MKNYEILHLGDIGASAPCNSSKTSINKYRKYQTLAISFFLQCATQSLGNRFLLKDVQVS